MKARPLRFEPVEDRRMLSVGPIGWNNSTKAITITSDAGSDSVSLLGQSSYVDVYVAGKFRARLTDANSSNVESITFNGQGGKDTLAITGITGVSAPGTSTLEVNLTNVESLSVLGGKDVAVAATFPTASSGSPATLTLGKSTFSGNLSVDLPSEYTSLTQSAAVTVAGTATFNSASTENIIITLTNAGNDLNKVAVPAGEKVSLRDVNSLALTGAWDIDGDLTLQANLTSRSLGALTQDAALTVGGNTTLAVGPASTITLGQDNALTGAVSITGANATLKNTLRTNLGTSTLTGNLNLTAVVADDPAPDPVIYQTGKVTVLKTATLSATYDDGATITPEDITLDTIGDNFGTVAVTNANNVTLRDANALVLGGISIAGSPATPITGNLIITTNGAITQTAPVLVDGSTTLAAGANYGITLTNIGNSLSGGASKLITVTSGRNVALRTDDAVKFGTSTISGTLAVTAGGAITQSDATTGTTPLKVTGKATFAAGSANNVTLSGTANQLSEVAVTSANDVSLDDSAGALALGTSNISGKLDIDAVGPITQTGPISVGGTTELTAAGALSDITWFNPINNFTGAVTVDDGRNLSLADINDLTLGEVTIEGSLTATVRGSLTGSEQLVVPGTTKVTAGRIGTVTLDNGDNELTGTISIVSAGTATLANTVDTDLGASNVTVDLNVTLDSAGATEITQSGPLAVGHTATFSAAYSGGGGGAGNVTLDRWDNRLNIVAVPYGAVVKLRDADSVTLGPSYVSGDLTVNAAGSIGQIGVYYYGLSVKGTATFNAGVRGNVDLNFDYNYFSGPVKVSAGGSAVLNNYEALELGQSNVSKDFTVSAYGPISQTSGENLTVGGKLTLDSSDNAITLGEANSLNEVGVTSGSAVTLNDVNGEGLKLAESTISGDLTVTSAGPVSQSGPLSVGGATHLYLAGNDATLGNDSNDFQGTVTIEADNVTLTTGGALDLGTSTISGNFDVTANGEISQSGNLEVKGKMTLDATGNDIDLSTGTNKLKEVAVTSGGVVSLKDTEDGLTLAASDALGRSVVSGDLEVTATAGAIQETGPWTVYGNAAFTAGDGPGNRFNVVLSDPDNDFHVLVAATGDNVTITNSGPLNLGGLNVDGDLLVQAGGTIGDNDPITVAGTATFVAQSADLTGYFDITLVDLASKYTGVVSFVGDNVYLINDTTTILGTSYAEGNLTVEVQSGDLTNVLDPSTGAAGAIVVDGQTELTVAGNVDLATATCKFADWAFADWPSDQSDLKITAGGNIHLFEFYALPTASDSSATVAAGDTLTFSAEDFESNFQTAGLRTVRITLLPAGGGTLKLGGVDVTLNQEIDIADLGDLTYEAPGAAGSDSFTWTGFDGFEWAATDATVDITIT